LGQEIRSYISMNIQISGKMKII